MSYTIQQLTDGIVATFKSYEATGTTPWNYEIAARDLSYQVGSLTKLLMQMHGERHAEKQTRDELMAQIADELADIMTDTLFIAHELGIDMNKAFVSMIESDKKKISARS